MGRVVVGTSAIIYGGRARARTSEAQIGVQQRNSRLAETMTRGAERSAVYWIRFFLLLISVIGMRVPGCTAGQGWHARREMRKRRRDGSVQPHRVPMRWRRG